MKEIGNPYSFKEATSFLAFSSGFLDGCDEAYYNSYSSIIPISKTSLEQQIIVQDKGVNYEPENEFASAWWVLVENDSGQTPLEEGTLVEFEYYTLLDGEKIIERFWEEIESDGFISMEHTTDEEPDEYGYKIISVDEFAFEAESDYLVVTIR